MREIVSPLSGFSSPFGRNLDAYKVGPYSPELVAAMSDGYYRAGRLRMNFDDLFTHAASSNATMVDSDGLLKWRPHNLQAHSDSPVDWVVAERVTVSGNTLTADAVSGTHRVYDQAITGISGVAYTYSFEVSAGTHNYVQIHDGTSSSYWANFDLSNGTVTSQTGGVASITQNGDKYICSLTFTSKVFPLIPILALIPATDSARNPSWAPIGTETVVLHKAWAYRSDLGGMVNNPDRGDSYVPTTSSAVYLPRRGHHVYNGDTWVNKGLLHESEARTNLVTYSEDFTQWSLPQTTVSANITTSPDGNNTADKLVPSTSALAHQLYEVFSLTSGVTYNFSGFFKAGGYDYVALRFGGALDVQAFFDLVNGTIVTNTSSGPATIEDWGNGWYRCALTETSSVTGSVALSVNIGVTSSSYRAAGDGTSGIYAWGVQVEQGSTPSSYIPTSGATVTRAAETLTVPAANLPWSGSAVSIQMQGEMTYADTDTATEARFFLWYADTGNYMLHDIQTDGTRTGRISFVQRETNSGLDSVRSGDASYSPGINVPFNIASRHGSTFINGAVDGTALTANLTPTALPDLSATNLQIGYDFMGTISLFRMWATDIGDTGIAEASA